ncbi:hypothetical protein BpHYR1_001633 [Brachionus plicatilis]|uniref:Uncharacterized protein n=1 Tax=Brachionus plicatilis TaxID=10195 RepID=A0A3M7P5H2_BRAPC|nr:hypothetical protein BpHYR1_001633 [Brachionus plicatilis]
MGQTSRAEGFKKSLSSSVFIERLVQVGHQFGKAFEFSFYKCRFGFAYKRHKLKPAFVAKVISGHVVDGTIIMCVSDTHSAYK